MKKEDKSIIINQIKETVAAYSHFYLTETQGMNAEQVSNLRRECFKHDIKMLVVKNKLMMKALEASEVDYSLKAAYVEEGFFIGENQLDALCAIKSKNELIAEVISLLQSPAKNVVSALQSGGSTIHGVLKTLSER